MTPIGMLLTTIATFSACGIAMWRAKKIFESGCTKNLEGWPRLKIALQNGILIGVTLIWIIMIIVIVC